MCYCIWDLPISLKSWDILRFRFSHRIFKINRFLQKGWGWRKDKCMWCNISSLDLTWATAHSPSNKASLQCELIRADFGWKKSFFSQNSKKSPDYFWFCIFTARYARTNVKIYSKVELHTPEKRLRDALETPQRHIREWRLCLICCWLNDWVSEHIMCLNIYHVILIHLSIYHLFVSSHWFACSHCGSS